MPDKEMEVFSSLVYKATGIVFNETKRQLILNRLNKRLIHYSISSLSEYYRVVTEGDHPEEMQVMIDLLTTNETYFFREKSHFDFIKETIIPNIASSQFRVWSAACSSGEEPYSLAMTISDAIRHDIAWEIIATDISTRMIERARRGLYLLSDFEDVPIEYLEKYCLKGVRSREGSILIDDKIRSHIKYFYLNLVSTWPDMGLFDVVLIRNVMFYFDLDTRLRLVDRICRLLKPGGYIIVSHSESLSGMTDQLKIIQPSIFRRVD